MSSKPPTEQDILQLARERLAEEQQRRASADAERDAQLQERDRYVAAFTELLGGLDRMVARLADQDVPIHINRTAENRAVVTLPTGARIVTAELLRQPEWIGADPVEVPSGHVRGAAYLGTTLNDRGVSDAVFGCNFLWVLPQGRARGQERWVACWTRVSALVMPQRIAERHGLSVPASAGRAFAIPFEEVLYRQLVHVGAVHTLVFEFSDDLEAAFRQVLAQALQL